MTGDEGTKTGTSPVTFPVLPGTYTIQATLAGYYDYSSVRSVGSNGGETEIDLISPDDDLTVASIETTPPGASVSITGVEGTQNITAPARIEVLPGLHTVTATYEGYEDYSQEFEIGNHGIDIEIRLEPGGERTEAGIETIPPGAFVSLTGVETVLSVTSPATIKVLPGTYTVRASLAGYEDYTEEYEISSSGIDIVIRLEPLPSQ
jgi:hypothetical protein